MTPGAAYLFKRSVAVVTEGPGPTRWPGSAAKGGRSDLQVVTLMIVAEGRVFYPVERHVDTVAGWEANGRRLV